MKQFHKNPRQITTKQFAELKEWLRELGDLSGIVHDLNSDEIIGGNQRGRVFDINSCKITMLEEYPQPDEQGTVGWGFIIWEGKKYAYRQVRWTEKQCEKANIIANKSGGGWDFDTLANQWNAEDLLQWGFSSNELHFFPNVGKTEPQTIIEQYMILIECESEKIQADLLELFNKDGLKCRALIS